jgi:FkbM family methyltransferase
MNLKELVLKNEQALKEKENITKVGLLTDSELLLKSKEFPYKGFVEVNITGVPEFLMFHNNDDVVARSYFWKGRDSYESTSLKLWSAISKKSPIVLDIGAYTGIYSLAAASVNLKSKIYSFEALDRIYSRLLVNKLLNNFANIETFNVIVSDVSGNDSLNIYSGESVLVSGSSTVDRSLVGKKPHHTKVVNSIKLDDKFKDITVSLIKIDVEGAELSVLNGIKNIIETSLPDILIEILEDANIKELNFFFSNHNYNYYSINDLTGEIKKIPLIVPSKDINSLNILITKKSIEEIKILI